MLCQRNRKVNHVYATNRVSHLLTNIEEGILTDQPRNVLATEVRENLARFPHCILLTRVGQFYEVITLTA